MGLVRVHESGSNPRSGRLDSSTRSYTRHIIMQVDSTADNVVSVYGYLAGLGIFWGQYYLVTDESGTLVNYDDGAFITAISPTRRADHPFLWDVIIEYSPYQLGGANGTHPTNMPARSGGNPQQNPNIQPNPLLRPPLYHWTTVPRQRLLSVDSGGNPVVNSAGQPFTNRRNRERKIRRLTIVRNELDFDVEFYDDYLETTNAVQFLHATPGCALMADITARTVYEGAIGRYYEVTFVIDFAKPFPTGPRYCLPGSGTFVTPDTFQAWAEALLDQGRIDFDGFPLVDSKGRPASTDMPLDGDGFQNATGDPPVYIVFGEYPLFAWGPLNLEEGVGD